MNRTTTRYVAGAAIAATLALGGVGLANAQSSETTDADTTVVVTDDAATDTGTDTGDAASPADPLDAGDATTGRGDRVGGPGADGEGRGPGNAGCNGDGTGATDGGTGTSGTTEAPTVIEEQAPTTVAPSTDAEVTVDAGDL